MADFKPPKNNIWDILGGGFYAAGGGDIANLVDRKKKQAFEEWKINQENDPQVMQQKAIATYNAFRQMQGLSPIDPSNMQGGRNSTIPPNISAGQSFTNTPITGTNPMNGFPDTQFRMGGSMTSPSMEPTEKSKAEQGLWVKGREEQIKTDQDMRKKIMTEESGANSALTLIKRLRKQWNATKPPNAGMLGIGGAGILPQPLYGMQQRIGAELQLTKNQQADRIYIKSVNSLRSRLAKGVIGNDVGNLSTYEQSAASGGLGGLSDVRQVGDSMFDETERMIVDMKLARQQGYKSLDEKLIAEGRTLTPELATEYLKKAGGDKEKARQLAIQDRWAF